MICQSKTDTTSHKTSGMLAYGSVGFSDPAFPRADIDESLTTSDYTGGKSRFYFAFLRAVIIGLITGEAIYACASVCVSRRN